MTVDTYFNVAATGLHSRARDLLDHLTSKPPLASQEALTNTAFQQATHANLHPVICTATNSRAPDQKYQFLLLSLPKSTEDVPTIHSTTPKHFFEFPELKWTVIFDLFTKTVCPSRSFSTSPLAQEMKKLGIDTVVLQK